MLYINLKRKVEALPSYEEHEIKKTAAAKYVGGHPDYPSGVEGTLTISKDELAFSSEKVKISVSMEKVSESLVTSKGELGRFLDSSTVLNLEDKKFLGVSYDDEGGARRTLILEIANPEEWAKIIIGYAYSEYLEE
jgi:hypothetical protein